MLTKRKSISKKEIKEDKLVETYYRAYGFFEEYKSKIAIYAGVLVLVIVAVYFYIQHRNANNEEAGLQLSRVMELYDAGSYLEAMEGRAGSKVVGLKKIVAEYGSTENGEIAKIYLANAYSFLGKQEDALKYYQDYSGSNDLFKATAIAGEAGYYAFKNEFEKAADKYVEASKVSEENVLNPDYMLSAAKNYMKVEKNDKAKELLENIRDNYTTSSAFREIDKYLPLLN
jgi:tetratricopeptide (TPR) repeat protein